MLMRIPHLYLQIFFCGTMNFLMRPTSVSTERSSISEFHTDTHHKSTSRSTLETLISEDPYMQSSPVEEYDGETDGVGGKNGTVTAQNSKDDLPVVAKHLDVSEEEGWIAIPYSMSLQFL